MPLFLRRRGYAGLYEHQPHPYPHYHTLDNITPWTTSHLGHHTLDITPWTSHLGHHHTSDITKHQTSSNLGSVLILIFSEPSDQPALPAVPGPHHILGIPAYPLAYREDAFRHIPTTARVVSSSSMHGAWSLDPRLSRISAVFRPCLLLRLFGRTDFGVFYLWATTSLCALDASGIGLALMGPMIGERLFSDRLEGKIRGRSFDNLLHIANMNRRCLREYCLPAFLR